MKTIYFFYFLALLFFFTNCGTNKDVYFKEMKNVKLTSLNRSGELTVKADAVMHNPRRVKAKVTYMECEVFIDGEKIADVAQLQEAKVPKRSDFTIPLETTVAITDVLKNAYSVISAAIKGGTIKTKMDGIVKVKVFGKQFSVPFVYEEDTPLRSTEEE